MQRLLDFLWFGAAGRCVRPPTAPNTSASDDARSIRLHQHMALRGKDLQQEIVFPGTPENLMQVVEQALRAGGFTKIEGDAEAAMCKGNYHKGTIWGELRIELDDDSPGHTRLHLRASAAKDNIWTALKGDPNERIIDRFTRCLPPPSPNTPTTQASQASVASELERLAGLRKQGVLSAEEFEAAKAKVLGS